MLGNFKFHLAFELEDVPFCQAWQFKLELERFIKSHPCLAHLYYSEVSFPAVSNIRRLPANDENSSAPKNGVFGAEDDQRL